MKRRIFSIILAGLLTASAFVSCSGSSGDTGVQTEPSVSQQPEGQSETETQTAAETEPEYVYPDKDFGGEEFKVFNIDEYWGMYVTVSPDELTGEALNDAVYQRNATVEAKLGCKISDIRMNCNKNLQNVIPEAKKTLLAGDDIYDVMYLPDSGCTSLILEGYLLDLGKLSGLHLDREWWDKAYNSSVSLGDSIYCASGDAYLMSYDSSWCLFFNEDMVSNAGLELPYDLVRSGKWTIDELHSYCSAIANLNGDESFAWKDGGEAVYGLVTHTNAPDKFVFGTGEKYVLKDEAGKPYFAADNERFYNAAQKLASLLGEDGTTLEGNADDFNTDRGYVYTFYNSRAAFLTAEIKAAQLMRDMYATFGIVPFPKYDEAQENYSTSLMNWLLTMTIPVTNPSPDDAAIVMDALAYESSKSVLPVYFDTTVSQKGLRNEDSVEMLEIMKNTRGADIAVVYNWNSELASAVATKLFKGDSSVSSDVAKYSTKITASIDELLEKFDI